MQIIIKTKNLELTPSLKNYINKRIEGLKKFVNKVSDIFVEVEKETLHHKKGEIFRTEALVHFPGKTLVAQAHGDDLGKVVTQVRDELKREIAKYKLKKIELPRRRAKKSKEENF